MQKKYWHGLDVETNAIGFGCWQIAGNHTVSGKPNGWGNVNPEDALDTLVYAMSNGIDLFDTAQGYNNGISEMLLGKAIKLSDRKDVTVCTKIAMTEAEINNQKIDDSFENKVELSLRNLQVETIDILLIHNPPDDLNWSACDFQILNELQKKGKIRSYGVSSRSLRGAESVVNSGFGTTIEWVFNMFERRPEKHILPAIKERKMNFIARSPLSRGFINPKYLNDFPSFENDDFRSTLPEEWIEWVISSLKKVNRNGVKEDDIVKQAILYCILNEAVTSCVVGIKTMNQLKDVLKINERVSTDYKFDIDLLRGIEECYPGWNN